MEFRFTLALGFLFSLIILQYCYASDIPSVQSLDKFKKEILFLEFYTYPGRSAEDISQHANLALEAAYQHVETRLKEIRQLETEEVSNPERRVVQLRINIHEEKLIIYWGQIFDSLVSICKAPSNPISTLESLKNVEEARKSIEKAGLMR